MKIRALANGNEFESDDGAAEALIATGLYERASDKKPAAKTAASPKPAKASSTAVKPMTTADIPQQPKKGKPIK